MIKYLADDLVSNSPEKLIQKPEAYSLWLDVFTQAERHTQFKKENELYSMSRPAEEDVFKAWRIANRRDITCGAVDRSNNMLTKILQYSTQNLDGISDALEKDLETDPFDFFGTVQNFDTFRYDSLLSYSMLDANGVVLEMPYLDNNKPFVPEEIEIFSPALSGKQNVKIRSITRVIPSFHIRNKTEVLSWYGGHMTVDAKKEQKEPYYWILDHEMYYFYKPVKDSKGLIVYELVPYYKHNCQFIPYTELMGRRYVETRIDKETGEMYNINYKRSFYGAAYSYFDETVIALSSDQVNRIRHLHAKLWVKADVKCTTCHGARMVDNSSIPYAVIQKEYGGKAPKIPCSSCHGTGQALSLGEFSTIINSSGRLPGDGQISGDPVGYATPPVQSLTMSGDIWRGWLKMGEDELCLNILEGTGSESSLAKNQRLEPKGEFIKDIGDEFNRMCSDIINNKECIIQPSATKRKKIQFASPAEYSYKSVSLLLQEFQESTAAQRVAKYKKYIELEYRNDNIQMDVHLKALWYSPLLLYTDGELMQALNSGAYTEQDLVRKDWAFEAAEHIITKVDKNGKLGIKEFREKCEEILLEWGILREELPLEGMGDVSTQLGEDGEPLEGNAATDQDSPDEDTNNTPSKGGANDKKIDDVLTLFIQGSVSAKVAAQQLSKLTGKTVAQIIAILENG